MTHRPSRSASRIKDARGKSVTQLDPAMLHVWHRYEVIEAEVLEAIVEELEPGTAKRRRTLIIMAPVTILLFALGLTAMYYFSDAGARRDLVSTLTNPAIMVPTVAGSIFFPWITARQTRLKRSRFAMLKYRRCPHCGYNLRGLPVAPEDGATVCPECGSAWLLDDAALAERLTATASSSGPTAQASTLLLVSLLVLSALALGGAVLFMTMLSA